MRGVAHLRQVLAPVTDRPAGTYAMSFSARALPVRRFVIFGAARSGTEFLISLLRSLPNVVCDSELFIDGPRPLAHRYLDGRAARARLLGARAWGFKITFEQLRWYGEKLDRKLPFLHALKGRGYTIIFLDRSSIMAQALSRLHVDATGRAHFQEGERHEFKPFQVDPVRLIAQLHWQEEYSSWAHDAVAGLADVTLSYEHDLQPVDRHQATADRICAALGLETAHAISSMVKVTPPSVRDRIKNYKEVADVVSRTRYAPFLDEL